MSQTITTERGKQIFDLLFRMDNVLKRFKFLSGGTDPEVVENWFRDAEARAVEIGKLDALFSGVHTLETMLVMQQAHDAYVLGLLDAVPVLCRTALEEELTMRYLVANRLMATTAAGTRFRNLADGKPAILENLIQWATTTNPQILTTTTPLARDIQEVGNDYVHAYAMRRAAKSMSGTGNLFTNTRGLEIYEKALQVFNQMP